jgi:hypothetical protein
MGRPESSRSEGSLGPFLVAPVPHYLLEGRSHRADHNWQSAPCYLPVDIPAHLDEMIDRSFAGAHERGELAYKVGD